MTCTEFSHDGKYVATADMGGLLQVWMVPAGKRVWSFETGDIEVCDMWKLYVMSKKHKMCSIL